MPERERVSSGMTVFLFVASLLVILWVPMVWGPKTDDPYFQQEICGGLMTPGGRATITASGWSTDCIEADPDRVRVVNRLAVPVTLCMGQSGVCDTGHESPIPGGRATLRPGESRKLKFPAGRVWFFGHQRTYPVTLLPVSGKSFMTQDMGVVAETHTNND